MPPTAACRSGCAASCTSGMADWLKTKPRVARRDPRLPPRAGLSLPARARPRRRRRDRALAREAAERLAAAAQAALVRGDAAAAARLLERAVALVPPEDPARSALLSTLGATLVEAGRLADADRVLAEAIARAEEAGDPRLESRARVEQELERLHAGTSRGRRAGAAASRTWRCRSSSATATTSAAAGRGACGRGSSGPRAARVRPTTRGGRPRRTPASAGDERELFDILGWRASAAAFGPDAGAGGDPPLRADPRAGPRAARSPSP